MDAVRPFAQRCARPSLALCGARSVPSTLRRCVSVPKSSVYVAPARVAKPAARARNRCSTQGYSRFLGHRRAPGRQPDVNPAAWQALGDEKARRAHSTTPLMSLARVDCRLLNASGSRCAPATRTNVGPAARVGRIGRTEIRRAKRYVDVLRRVPGAECPRRGASVCRSLAAPAVAGWAFRRFEPQPPADAACEA
jgi:hypothetical protein